MFEVNNTEMKGNIKELGNLLNRYDEIMLNLYRQLDESCVNWQDANSLSFIDCVQDEKKETSLFVDYLKSRKEIYDFIYEKYSELGKKVAYNLNNKNSILQLIEDCYGRANNILNQFYYIDTSFYYEERWSIIQQRDKMANTRNKLLELKNSISTLFNKIENIEKEVNKKIKALSTIKIGEFAFYFNSFGETSISGHKKSDGLLIRDGLEKNIELIKLYNKEEKDCLNKVYNKLNSCNSSYKTSYVSDLNNSIEPLKTHINEINIKREKCANTLNDVINLYETTAKNTAKYFDSVGDKNE